MALFIATLALPPGALIDVAKLGILLASVTAGSVGLLVGRFLLPATRSQP
jgi:Na+/H+ antiporter NhaA